MSEQMESRMDKVCPAPVRSSKEYGNILAVTVNGDRVPDGTESTRS